MKRLTAIVVLAFALCIVCYLGARHVLYNKYSNAKAVEYLDSHAESHSVNRCALYVRQAISAGGCPTFGQPPSACDYEYFLPELGFRKVENNSYVPQKGDITVFSAIAGHKHGHICMYDGNQWVSDFRQRSMYSANAYRHQGTHTYWRRPDGCAWRKVTLNSWKRYIKISLGI